MEQKPREACMELEQAAESVLNYVGELVSQPARYKLVLLVGQDEEKRSTVVGEVAKRAAYPVLDVGLELSKELVLIPEARRPLNASSVFKNLAKEQVQQSAALVVDNIGILFDRSLELSPLDLMEDLSISVTLVVSWPGTITWNKDGTVHMLTHANPDNDEYKCYNHVHTAAVVDLNTESAT
jgi:hypothetical protein